MGFKILLESGSALLLEDGASAPLLEAPDAGAGNPADSGGFDGDVFDGGEINGAPAAALPRSLLAAIVARYRALGLTSSIGPIYARQTPAGAVPPYVVVSEVGSGGQRLNATDGYWEHVLVQFSAVASGAVAAEDAGRAIKAAFDPAHARPRLTFADGNEMTVRRGTGALQKQPGRDRANNPLWAAFLQYTFSVSRQM